MPRKLLILIACVLLAACGRFYTPYQGPSNAYAVRLADERAGATVSGPVAPGNAFFSYEHSLSVSMARKNISPRFERARDRCLKDASLNCTLLSASVDSSEGDYSGVSAELILALPHENVAKFEKALLVPVRNESPDDAKIASRSTIAENVSQQAGDASRKLAQLTDYRDRLAALAKRPNLSVADMIKIDAELSKAQSDLDDAKSTQAVVADRVAKERLSISLFERPGSGAAFKPLARVWSNAVQIFGDSMASALQFMIGVIPWLPIIIGVGFLIRWLWRIARRRPNVAVSPTKGIERG